MFCPYEYAHLWGDCSVHIPPCRTARIYADRGFSPRIWQLSYSKWRQESGYEMFLNEFSFCRHYAHSGSETTCARRRFNLYDRLRARLALAKEALNKYILLHSTACCCSGLFISSQPLGSEARHPRILTRGGVYSWAECISCCTHAARRQLHLSASSSGSVAKK